MTPAALPDPVAVAGMIGRQLEKLGVPYVVGGSFASSLHGKPRSTNDVDIVADLDEPTVRLFVHSLGEDFYADASVATEAVRAAGSFNIVHSCLPQERLFVMDFTATSRVHFLASISKLLPCLSADIGGLSRVGARMKEAG